MAEFLAQWLLRAAVMIPVIVLVSAACWWMLSRFGVMRADTGFNAADMRTWPLSFALLDAAVFAVVFSAIAAWMGDSTSGVPVAAGVAAFIAIGLPHLLGAGAKAK